MFSFLTSEKKKQKKHIEHAIFQVKYARRMKEDLLEPAKVERLRKLQADLKGHLKARRYEDGVALADNAAALARDVHPAPRGAYALRENVEVFVVVVAVALGFRTYFFQPYQIPTGSMQPTLYGITSRADYEPDWTDKPPARWAKFLLTGSRYKEIRAKDGGIVPPTGTWEEQDTFVRINIGGRRYKIHKHMIYREVLNPKTGDLEKVLLPGFPRPGTAVREGQVIAKGLLKQGDHIIVDRVTPNFTRPERGDIVVFSTANLPLVRANSAYIKRLVGLPGETIRICDGKLFADGEVVDTPGVFERQYEDPRYSGYANAGRLDACDAVIELGDTEFLMMGDNTLHSLDGRYFGGVPGRNIIGLGVFVPWPFVNRGIYNDSAGPVR